jgi:hypothetical protein
LVVAAAAAASQLLVSIPGTTQAWALLVCSVNLSIWCGFLCDHLPILVRRFSLDFFVWLHSEAVWVRNFSARQKSIFDTSILAIENSLYAKIYLLSFLSHGSGSSSLMW